MSDPKVFINNKPFYHCYNNDPFCLSDLYSINPDGTANNSNSNNNILYFNKFFLNKNKSFINCPTGYSPIKNSNTNNKFLCYDNNIYCNPNNSDSESLTGFNNCSYSPNQNKLINTNIKNNLEDCLNDCSKNNDCKSLSSSIDLDGSHKCFYYNIDQSQFNDINIKRNIVDNKGNTILIKNDNYNPFNIQDINNFYPAPNISSEAFSINEFNNNSNYDIIYINIIAVIIMSLILSNIIIKNQFCAKIIVLPIIFFLGFFIFNLFINTHVLSFFIIYFFVLLYLYYIKCFTF